MTQDCSFLFLKQYYHQANLLSWQENKSQQQVLEKIAQIYQPHLFQKNRWSWIWASKKTPTGIYLYGPVGRGKTVLMDIVTTALPSARKIRWHFTEFMQKIHQLNADFGKSTKKEQPIDQTIQYLKSQYDYLFLDELEVTEIADAMILGRLFKGLSEAGMIIFLTSNTAPDQLYQGGLHYDRFHPFVIYIQSIFQIFKLTNDHEIDFRTMHNPSLSDPLTLDKLKQLFMDIVTIEGYHPIQFIVNQRTLKLTNATKTTLWLDFNEFGQKAYGAADYQLIAKNFRCVFLINVPQFNQENQNASRRFITLIDCLYDNQVILYLQLHTSLENLFTFDKKNPLPFQRTVSRLIEMEQRN
jgi:predicted ATPase